MPRKKNHDGKERPPPKGPHHDARHAPQPAQPPLLSQSSHQPIDTTSAAAASAMAYLLSIVGGRYSVNRHQDGNTYHKMGYSLGEWAEHYIMYVGHKFEDWETGALGLLAKQLAVEEGRLKPTYDRWKVRN